MPKVYLQETDKLLNNLKEFIYGRLRNKHLSQSKLAEDIGISKQTFSNKMKALTFTTEELIEMFDVLEVSEEEVTRFFIKKKGAKCIS